MQEFVTNKYFWVTVVVAFAFGAVHHYMGW